MTNNLNMLQRFVIGNDPLLRLLNSATLDNYPPYNVIQIEKNKYKIELAVAGFSPDEVVVEQKKDVLHVYSKPSLTSPDEGSAFTNDSAFGSTAGTASLPFTLPNRNPEFPRVVHQGLASRSFMKSWSLGEGWKTRNANLQNGVLTIIIEYEVPEDQKAVSIPITTDDRVTLKG